MPEANSMADAAAKYDRLIRQKKCTIADDCAICIDSVLAKPVMYLPCKHFFHQACLNQAFEKKLYTCPLCRYDLLEPLLKANFKFPMVYDMNTYMNTFFYTYPNIYPYTDHPDDENPDEQYDDMPELIDDSDDPDVSWNQLFYNVMHNVPADAGAGSAAALGSAALGSASLIPVTEAEYVVQDVLIIYTI
jgi:hypothetical protein